MPQINRILGLVEQGSLELLGRSKEQEARSTDRGRKKWNMSHFFRVDGDLWSVGSSPLGVWKRIVTGRGLGRD